MANIKKWLDQIANAKFGRDVRSSIYNAIDAVNSSAEGSAAAAEKSAAAAATSATEAQASETAAGKSATDAVAAATAAQASETAAGKSATDAVAAATAAQASETAAGKSATGAVAAATEAQASETAAGRSAADAGTAAASAQESAASAGEMADAARSWARGTGGEVREGDEVDNSLFYSLQSQRYAELAQRYYEKIEQAGYKICGDYDNTASYDYPDVVYYNGSSYVAKKETTGNVPGNDSEYWQIFASGVPGVIKYDELKDKPTINDVEIAGAIELIDLGIIPSDWQESDESSMAYIKNKPDFAGMEREVSALKKSVSDGKTLVANAVTKKGVTTATDATFATIAGNIEQIKTTPDLQEKAVTLNTNTPSAVIVPDDGYDGLSRVEAGISLQEKTQSLLYGSVAITPDSGKVLSRVSVNGPADKSGVTVDAGAVTQDNNYTYFGIPAAGYYDAKSKLRSANSNINKIYTVNGVAMKNGALTTFNVGFRAKYIAIYIPNNYLCAYVDDNGNIQYAFRADSSAYIIVNDTTVQMFCSWGSGTRTADVLIAK